MSLATALSGQGFSGGALRRGVLPMGAGCQWRGMGRNGAACRVLFEPRGIGLG